MHWLLLLLAIGSEIVATSALKETQGFTRLLPSLLCIGGYAMLWRSTCSRWWSNMYPWA